MVANTIPKVKICCIGSWQEAELAIEAGADAIGLVSEMPSGPGVISEQLIAEIASKAADSVETFLLTSRLTADTIIEQHRRCKTTTIQLVDQISRDEHLRIREALPGVSLVQVIHVTGKESVEEALAVEPYVDKLLLDSGNPSLETKELGGTGRTHDWSVSREIVNAVSLPVFLAGGLNPSNAAKALQQVEPYGLDVCSGLRSSGSLDPKKVYTFFEQLGSKKAD